MRWVAGPFSVVVVTFVGMAALAGCASDGAEPEAADATTTTAGSATRETTTTVTSGSVEPFAVLAGEGVPADLDALAANLQDRLVAAGHDDGIAVVAGDRVEVTPGPGPLDAAALDDLLATPGRLEMRPVLEVLPPDCDVVEPTGTPEVAVYPALEADGTVTACYSLAPSGLTNDAIEAASATILPTGDLVLTDPAAPSTTVAPGDQWVVNPVLTEAGIDAFNELAAECNATSSACPTGMIAIAVDGVVLSAPTVQQPAYERDQIQISGGGGQDPASATFTEAEARALAAALRVEPLPSGLEVVR